MRAPYPWAFISSFCFCSPASLYFSTRLSGTNSSQLPREKFKHESYLIMKTTEMYVCICHKIPSEQGNTRTATYTMYSPSLFFFFLNGFLFLKTSPLKWEKDWITDAKNKTNVKKQQETYIKNILKKSHKNKIRKRTKKELQHGPSQAFNFFFNGFLFLKTSPLKCEEDWITGC